MSEQRRDIRYPARIVARVVRRNESIELLTNDVSFRGAFLRTDAPPAMRQLVRVAFVLPGATVVSAHAMVVHVVGVAPNGPVPGMGVQFWGAVDGSRAWEKFVHELKALEKEGVPSARYTDKVRRASERFRLSLDVVVDGNKTTTRDVSMNGMAIKTDLALQVGMRARLQVYGMNGDMLALDIVVRRVIKEKDFSGLGVEFVDVPSETRTALVALVRAKAPGEEVIFISPNDPKLL